MLPAADLDRKGDSMLHEASHVIEAKLGRDVHATANESSAWENNEQRSYIHLLVGSVHVGHGVLE